jgi:hypothetical protein
MSSNPIHQYKEKWYFWNEIWVYRIGPYDSEEIAKEKLDEYFEFLNKGDDR